MNRVGDILKIVGSIIPEGISMEWDNPGLQVGNPGNPARGIIVSLDADIELLEKARQTGANIAITHHPLIFNPLKRLDLLTPVGRVIEMAVKYDMSIYAAHTNLDAMTGGVNDTLAGRLRLTKVKAFGDLGRIGDLRSGMSLMDFSKIIKREFSIPHLSLIGEDKRKVKRVAVCGGSGGALIREAHENGADVLVTGDVKYHAARDAEAYGLSVIDIGHFASESVILPVMASMIKDALKKEGIKIALHVHTGNDPIKVC